MHCAATAATAKEAGKNKRKNAILGDLSDCQDGYLCCGPGARHEWPEAAICSSPWDADRSSLRGNQSGRHRSHVEKTHTSQAKQRKPQAKWARKQERAGTTPRAGADRKAQKSKERPQNRIKKVYRIPVHTRGGGSSPRGPSTNPGRSPARAGASPALRSPETSRGHWAAGVTDWHWWQGI